MRIENNGVSSQGSAGNGTSSSIKSVETNGNGVASSVRNGSTKPDTGSNSSSFTMLAPPTPKPSYFGHDREEITRIAIQSLVDLGYHRAAAVLEEESEYTLESLEVSEFRTAVLKGQWSKAEELLFGLEINKDYDVNVSLWMIGFPSRIRGIYESTCGLLALTGDIGHWTDSAILHETTKVS